MKYQCPKCSQFDFGFRTFISDSKIDCRGIADRTEPAGLFTVMACLKHNCNIVLPEREFKLRDNK